MIFLFLYFTFIVQPYINKIKTPLDAIIFIFLIAIGMILGSYFMNNGYLGIFKHIFCKHSYENIGGRRVYGKFHGYKKCTKCGKVKGI